MRQKTLAAILLGTVALSAGIGTQHRWRAPREATVPAPPAWLRGAALAACPGILPAGYEAYFAKGGAWLVKLTDGRTGTPREVLFLGGRNSGRVLPLGEVFYAGITARAAGLTFKASLRE